jgi:voltage-gated potassium channel
MSDKVGGAPEHSNSYNIFMLVLTVLSLGIMVLLLLPLSPATIDVLTVYDNVVCIVFLADFTMNLLRSPSKRDYFIGRRGWLDLLGSVPSFGFFRFTALLRLARLSRLARIARLLQGESKKALVADVVKNRGTYAAFITVLSAFMVLVVSSVLVLQFESGSPDANITTGGDSLWWAFVTITTVGYGDRFPITLLGRLTGVAVMAAGIGIIGALASILASILVPQADKPEPVDPTVPTLAQELADIKAELAGLRAALAGTAGADGPRID